MTAISNKANMVKDRLGQAIAPGNYVFYCGSLYQVERVIAGTTRDPGHYVRAQYAGEEYELKQLKKIWSCSVCLVDTAAAETFIRAQEIKRGGVAFR